MMPSHPPVAFFDFDGTLTRGDSLMPFLRQLAGTPKFLLEISLLSPVLAAYLCGWIRNDRAKVAVLKRLLRGRHRDELFRAGTQFSRSFLPKMVRPEGMERLQWHQSEGHCCVLVSASLDVYLETWAREHGMDALICSQLIYDHELATGELAGNNCFGPEKVKRVQAWLKERQVATTYAYGDSKGDLPLLRTATYGHLWNGRQFVRVET